MEMVGIGEKKKARDTSSSFCDESLYYASDWKRGAYSFPSGTTGSMGTPFTRAQWLELQRQAMVYKHITASVPVPPYLLVPFHYTNASYCMIGGAGGLVDLGFVVNRSDPEPRRCRRTDGKKWRCSKDAAPDQKHCERHMHRGKPRSRKPVEAPKSKAPESIISAAVAAATTHGSNSVYVAPPVVRGGVDNPSWNYTGFSDPYGLLGNEEDKSSSQLNHAGSNARTIEAIPDGDTSKQQYNSSLSLNYADMKDYSFSLLNSDLSSLNESSASMPDENIERREYIDAWSTEKAATLTSTGSLASLDLQHFDLSLSMSNDQTDLGIANPSATMQSPMAWTNHDSSLCGPLGEFFQPNQQFHIDVAEEPHGSEMIIDESDEIGPEQSPARPVAWSPTGVLQKTFSSHSDNSNASSPSFVGMGSTIYHQHVLPDF